MKKLIAIVILTVLLVTGCQPEQSPEDSTQPVEPVVSEPAVAHTPIPAADIPTTWEGEAPDDITITPGGYAYVANVHQEGVANPWSPIESASVMLGSSDDAVNVRYRDYIETAAGESRNNIISVTRAGGFFNAKLELYSGNVPAGVTLGRGGGGGLPGTLGAVLAIEIAPDITPGEYPLEIGLMIDGKDYGTVTCTVKVLELLTEATPEVNNNYRSDENYLSVNLPEGWVAVEGPESLVSTSHLIGQVSFNSWGEEGFWAREEVHGTSSTYGLSTVMNSLSPGGAYIVLVQINMPPAIGYEPEEYPFNDLSGLLTPDNWQPGPGFNSYYSFYKWGESYELQVACDPAATGETIEELKSILASWRFDSVPTGDAEWMGIQARKLLPEEVEPLKFSNRAGSRGEDGVSRITEVEDMGNLTVFRFIYEWADSSHWWEVEISPTGEAALVSEGGEPLPFD